jgi:nucleoside 2-deoxyribosyltransferase
MDYYFQEVLPDVDVGVFLPFEDGVYGAGTAAEIGFLLYQEKPVYEIDRDGEISELLDVLSIDETKERVYGDD